MSNRDLDLPTQQELLAQYRCDEIAGAAFETLLSQVGPLRAPIEGGRMVQGLGTQIKSMCDTAVGTYQNQP